MQFVSRLVKSRCCVLAVGNISVCLSCIDLIEVYEKKRTGTEWYGAHLAKE